MEITFELTEDDFYDAMKACRKAKTVARWVLPFATAALTLILADLVFVVSPRNTPWTDLLPLVLIWIFCLAVLIVIPMSQRSAARKQFNGNPSAKGLITLAASESGVRLQSQHTESTTDWSSFVLWGEGKSVFALMISPAIFLAVPKRAFSAAQLIEFRELVRSKISRS